MRLSEVDQFWVDGCRLQDDRVEVGRDWGAAGARPAIRMWLAFEGQKCQIYQ